MPKLSRIALRVAFVYLLCGALAAALYWLAAIDGAPDWIAALSPVYVHLIVVGWLTQFIFGVLYWMFPVLGRTNPRGNERLAWIAFGLLNAGLVLRVIGEPWRAVAPGPLNQAVLVLSSLIQLAAVGAWVAVAWPRVRERGVF